MTLSFNEYPYDGSTDEYDVNFALGYAAQSDVGVVRVGTTPINISFNWIGPSRIRINTADLVAGDVIRIYRTVSKTSLPIDLTQPNRLTREDVQTAMLHSIYIAQEVLDGRVASFSEVDEIVLQTAADLVTAALEGTDLLVTQRYPLIVHGSTDVPLLFTCPIALRSEVDEVTVNIDGFPLVPVVYELSDEEGVQLLINIYPDGTATVETESGLDSFTLARGVIRLEAQSDNYYDGEIAIGINGLDENIVTTTEDFPIFFDIYTNARDAV